MNPYYEHNGITIYHGDALEILPTIDPATVGLLLTDPPYGMDWDTDYDGRGMTAATQSHTYPKVAGDDKPFDPAHLLGFRKIVLFGANHYANKLPTSAGWLVWDKTGNGRHVSDLSDAELAWTNVTGGVRTFSHMWKGMMKDSERSERRCHPTQKPVALMTWILEKWTKPGDLILDPYMGSGPIARACHEMNRRYIGIELVEAYCEIAVKRLSQSVLAF